MPVSCASPTDLREVVTGAIAATSGIFAARGA
jgi:hypothetical protein